MHKNSQQRVQLYLLLATAVSVFFWVVSRYPALLKKLAKGTTQVHQAWAFDLLWKEHLDAGIMERVGGNFFNWCYTNWKGMTYGILVATILLPMFQHLRTMRFQNPWLRTLFGVGMGVPLGLCANCATPVSLGLKKGGVGTETAVSTLMASPTLNVTCLIMAFTMLPLSFAGMKVGATLLVLTTVPFLTRLTTKPESEQPLDIACDVPAPESWAERLRGVLRELGHSFLFMLKGAVPWMLVAGFLGAVLFELLPVDWFKNLAPTLPNIFLVSLVGTFVPAPMTFDVIFSAKMLQAGAPKAFAMAMLFSLGIFSIYPMLVIGRTISPKLPLGLFGAVWIISSLSAALIGIF